MLDNADALFDRPPKNAGKKINRLENELRRKDQFIAVVTEEALAATFICCFDFARVIFKSVKFVL